MSQLLLGRPVVLCSHSHAHAQLSTLSGRQPDSASSAKAAKTTKFLSQFENSSIKVVAAAVKAGELCYLKVLQDLHESSEVPG